MRSEARIIGAPPTFAANAPVRLNDTNDAATINSDDSSTGAITAVSTGRAQPADVLSTVWLEFWTRHQDTRRASSIPRR